MYTNGGAGGPGCNALLSGHYSAEWMRCTSMVCPCACTAGNYGMWLPTRWAGGHAMLAYLVRLHFAKCNAAHEFIPINESTLSSLPIWHLDHPWQFRRIMYWNLFWRWKFFSDWWYNNIIQHGFHIAVHYLWWLTNPLMKEANWFCEN
jgi:hypothetical protein